MTKPDERRIELYTYGGTLSLISSEDNHWLRKWIDYDEDIKKLESWFKKFYATFNQIEASKDNRYDIPPAVHLTPWKTTLSLPNPFKRAVQMPITEANGATLKTVMTFVSDIHKTILRISLDERNQQLSLHVISTYVSPDDIVLLRVNTVDPLLVSEPGGSFHFPDAKTESEPGTDTEFNFSLKKIANWTRCELYLAVDKIRVYKDSNTGEINFDTTELRRDRQALNLTCTNNELQITFNPDFSDKEHPQRVVFNSGRQSKDIEINTGVCSIPLDKMSGSQACIYFYDV